MKKAFIFYTDFDGILNLFEQDKNARINMWNPGYFLDIPVREGISDLLERINSEAYVVILTKVINRIGVTKEKTFGLKKIFPQMLIVMLFMCLMIEVNQTICILIILQFCLMIMRPTWQSVKKKGVMVSSSLI